MWLAFAPAFTINHWPGRGAAMARTCSLKINEKAFVAAAALLLAFGSSGVFAKDGDGGGDDGLAEIEQIHPDRDDDGRPNNNTNADVIRQSGTGNTTTIEQQAVQGSFLGDYAGIRQYGS